MKQWYVEEQETRTAVTKANPGNLSDAQIEAVGAELGVDAEFVRRTLAQGEKQVAHRDKVRPAHKRSKWRSQGAIQTWGYFVRYVLDDLLNSVVLPMLLFTYLVSVVGWLVGLFGQSLLRAFRFVYGPTPR